MCSFWGITDVKSGFLFLCGYADSDKVTCNKTSTLPHVALICLSAKVGDMIVAGRGSTAAGITPEAALPSLVLADSVLLVSTTLGKGSDFLRRFLNF